jgi:flagellar biosynthesis protein FlhF
VRNNFPALVVKTVIAANSQYRCMRRAMPDTDIRDGDGIILTKVDEAASLGEALSALLRGPLPLSFVCDGQAVPNDLHIACASVLVGAAESLSHSSADDIDDDWFGSQAGQAMMRG